jgi:predicted transcriptional regulator
MLSKLPEQEQKIIEYLRNFKKIRGNKCGCSIVTIHLDLKIPMSELKIHIRNLHKQYLITHREGVNHTLIYAQ